MNWHEFLRYSKYIAVFYATAFIIGLLGIWMQPAEKYIWTAAMFFGAALAGNVALGFYHANHRPEMKFAKAEYLQKTKGNPGVQDITSSRDLVILSDESGTPVLSPGLSDLVDEVARKAARSARGY